MAAAQDAMANQIGAAIVRQLGLISADHDAPRWLTSPKQIVRGGAGWIPKIARPGLIVSVYMIDDVPQQALLHEAKAFFRVWLVTDDDDTDEPIAEVLLHRMGRDVVTALTNNETFTANNMALIETLSGLTTHMDDEGSDRFALGIGRVEGWALYKWVHGAP